jgi:hypothetical protein
MTENRAISYAELAAEDFARQDQGRFAGRGPRVEGRDEPSAPLPLQHHLIDHVGLEPPIDARDMGPVLGVALSGKGGEGLGDCCPYFIAPADCRLLTENIGLCVCRERLQQ